MRPISRYYDFGLTFRWVRGDSYVAVKRGYVVEGHAALVVREMRNPRTVDRPNDVVGQDQATWVDSFPISPDRWSADDALPQSAIEWAKEHKDLADWTNRPRRPEVPPSERR